MSEHESIFRWQERALGPLLGWGIGSVVAGAGLATAREPVLRHVGLQALGWGAVDALLALNGRRGARQQLGKPHSTAEEQHNARRFGWIVGVNAALDGGYIAGGWWLARRNPRNDTQRGTGIGIMVQGAWLLGYDLLLLAGVLRWLERRERTT